MWRLPVMCEATSDPGSRAAHRRPPPAMPRENVIAHIAEGDHGRADCPIVERVSTVSTAPDAGAAKGKSGGAFAGRALKGLKRFLLQRRASSRASAERTRGLHVTSDGASDGASDVVSTTEVPATTPEQTSTTARVNKKACEVAPEQTLSKSDIQECEILPEQTISAIGIKNDRQSLTTERYARVQSSSVQSSSVRGGQGTRALKARAPPLTTSPTEAFSILTQLERMVTLLLEDSAALLTRSEARKVYFDLREMSPLLGALTYASYLSGQLAAQRRSGKQQSALARSLLEAIQRLDHAASPTEDVGGYERYRARLNGPPRGVRRPWPGLLGLEPVREVVALSQDQIPPCGAYTYISAALTVEMDFRKHSERISRLQGLWRRNRRVRRRYARSPMRSLGQLRVPLEREPALLIEKPMGALAKRRSVGRVVPQVLDPPRAERRFSEGSGTDDVSSGSQNEAGADFASSDSGETTHRTVEQPMPNQSYGNNNQTCISLQGCENCNKTTTREQSHGGNKVDDLFSEACISEPARAVLVDDCKAACRQLRLLRREIYQLMTLHPRRRCPPDSGFRQNLLAQALQSRLRGVAATVIQIYWRKVRVCRGLGGLCSAQVLSEVGVEYGEGMISSYENAEALDPDAAGEKHNAKSSSHALCSSPEDEISGTSSRAVCAEEQRRVARTGSSSQRNPIELSMPDLEVVLAADKAAALGMTSEVEPKLSDSSEFCNTQRTASSSSSELRKESEHEVHQEAELFSLHSGGRYETPDVASRARMVSGPLKINQDVLTRTKDPVGSIAKQPQPFLDPSEKHETDSIIHSHALTAESNQPPAVEMEDDLTLQRAKSELESWPAESLPSEAKQTPIRAVQEQNMACTAHGSRSVGSLLEAESLPPSESPESDLSISSFVTSNTPTVFRRSEVALRKGGYAEESPEGDVFTRTRTSAKTKAGAAVDPAKILATGQIDLLAFNATVEDTQAWTPSPKRLGVQRRPSFTSRGSRATLTRSSAPSRRLKIDNEEEEGELDDRSEAAPHASQHLPLPREEEAVEMKEGEIPVTFAFGMDEPVDRETVEMSELEVHELDTASDSQSLLERPELDAPLQCEERQVQVYRSERRTAALFFQSRFHPSQFGARICRVYRAYRRRLGSDRRRARRNHLRDTRRGIAAARLMRRSQAVQAISTENVGIGDQLESRGTTLRGDMPTQLDTLAEQAQYRSERLAAAELVLRRLDTELKLIRWQMYYRKRA